MEEVRFLVSFNDRNNGIPGDTVGIIVQSVNTGFQLGVLVMAVAELYKEWAYFFPLKAFLFNMGTLDPYAAAHLDPQGAGDARPTALQIIQDEGVEGKLADKVIVITGATSGIGVETARALSATGATLLLTARNRSKAENNLAGVLEPNRVSLADLDLDSFASIRAGAKEILAASKGQINILINNAGIMGPENRTLTKDGIEVQFASNYLGFFLLFQLLKEAMLASVTLEHNSRVVVVTSSAHRAATLPNSDNYSFENGGYSHEIAYYNAKLAEVYLANTIERLYGAQGLHATSLHPGVIKTDIFRNVPPEFLETLAKNPCIPKISKSFQQGAATTVWAAVGKDGRPRVAGISKIARKRAAVRTMATSLVLDG